MWEYRQGYQVKDDSVSGWRSDPICSCCQSKPKLWFRRRGGARRLGRAQASTKSLPQEHGKRGRGKFGIWWIKEQRKASLPSGEAGLHRHRSIRWFTLLLGRSPTSPQFLAGQSRPKRALRFKRRDYSKKNH